MPATTYRDDAPGPGSTVWYATGLGWRQADGGTLASGWISGDPDGRGTPSTAAEEQVRVSPFPNKKNNPDFPITVSPADIPAYRMASAPLWRAQTASEREHATQVAACHEIELQRRIARLAERIACLERDALLPRH